MRVQLDQPLSFLARALVIGTILHIDRRGQCLIPLFQFHLPNFSIRPVVAAAISELSCGFDGWELTSWFAQPNSWLKGAAPVDVLANDGPEVLQASRADRFVALG